VFRVSAVLLILVPLAELARDPADVGVVQQTQTVAAGKKQFAQTCGFCHGRDGRGASGPDLIRSTLVNHDVNGNLIGEVVRNGRPTKGMPAFQLSDDQIRVIATFLHGEASSAASVARHMPTDYPVEKLLVGDAERGAQYFRAHCMGCHSISGDLAHIATRYKPFDLQTRITFPAGTKARITVTEPSGITVEGDEIYGDEFYVTLRDKTGLTHTYKRNSDVKITIIDPLAEHERLLKSYTDENVHDVFAYLETLK
jgi:cytochrome c oxidase cbb3-type subunit 3